MTPKKTQEEEEPSFEEEMEKSTSEEKGKEKSAEEDGKRKRSLPTLLRGFRDILPDEQGKWFFLTDAIRRMADAYSFDRIELPLLEKADLFTRTIGKQSDIIQKEMYVFEDQAGDKVALRPEGTASIARAYINHGMLNLPQPVKLWYQGAMFRHDRPQAGRYRQFHQAGFEVIGSEEAIVDAQLIVLAHRLLKDVGIPVSVQINSIGTPACRKEYLGELVNYFRPFRKKLNEDDKRRLQKNPLRVLDSKDPAIAELLKDAPQIVDWLDEESKAHFMKVLEFLDEAEVPYALNPYLVRGLDYYTHTVFELWEEGDGGELSQNALGGGGRYDGLLDLLGGRPTPACGFAIGLERIVRSMTERKIEPPARIPARVFFAQLGDAARRVGLRLFEEFRKANIPVAEATGKNALKAQLEVANKLGAAYTLILGQKEVLDGTIIIRDMDSGAQEIVDMKKVASILERKLEQSEGVNPLSHLPVADQKQGENVGSHTKDD
jgi:histidyl-tRNA synthetase